MTLKAPTEIDSFSTEFSRIFISYARKDGREFAMELRRRLREDHGLSVWQDFSDMEGGKGWWQQIYQVLTGGHARYLVLVMTQAAVNSRVVRNEWRLARQEGVCVIPIIAADDLKIDNLPHWMKKIHFVNPTIPEQWTRLIQTLDSPCRLPRVPFMADDIPDDFVERPTEFDQLLERLLSKNRGEPVAITAALKGAGGFGKTTLAKALCHHPDIQNAFDDGILWVSLGETPGDLTGHVNALIYTLSGEREGLADIEAAIARLSELLADRDILMVIDDVWNGAHLKPFMRGGPRCARLITTRNTSTLPTNTQRVDVDAMRHDEAVALLNRGLAQGEDEAFRYLASRLGYWPLLLKLVNGVLRERVNYTGQSPPAALTFIKNALDKRGLTFFDACNAETREQAVAKTIGVSLEHLNPDELARYKEVVVFPEELNIPLSTLEKLWHKTAGFDEISTEALCDRLNRLSLLLKFDPTTRHIRIHNVVRQYLIELRDDIPTLHGRLVEAWGDLHRLPDP